MSATITLPVVISKATGSRSPIVQAAKDMAVQACHGCLTPAECKTDCCASGTDHGSRLNKHRNNRSRNFSHLGTPTI